MDGKCLAIHLFGPMVVDAGDQRIGNFRSQKTVALLAYAILEHRPLSRDHLAALLWPNATASEARGHLRRSLHDLSQKLPGILIGDYHTLQFNDAFDPGVDLFRYQSLVESGDLDSLKTAATLCRGQLLEGLALDDCPDYETWLEVEREIWRMKCTSVLETLLTLSDRGDQVEEALAYGWQLLGLQPWREDIHRQLMMLLARAGQRNMALRQYRLCCRSLLDDLGVEPSQETRQLAERVRRADLRFSASELPAQTPFIGRRDELERLAGFLSDPACRVVTITGLRGIGKSRLALEAGREAANSARHLFLDGVRALRPAGSTATKLRLADIGLALGITSQHPSSDAVITHYLRDREMLLIFDDLPALEGSGLVRAIIDSAPQLKFLVTSDRPLGLPGERILPLGPLSTIPALDSSMADAVSLFANTVEREAGRRLSPAEQDAAARMCDLLDGWPLAIELAAGWCSLMTCDFLLNQVMSDPLSLAAAPNQEITQGNGPLVRALEQSCAFLDMQERGALEELVGLGAEFDLGAAAAVGVTPGTVARLLGRGFVWIVPTAAEGLARMRIHRLLHRYLLDQARRLSVKIDRQGSLLNLSRGQASFQSLGADMATDAYQEQEADSVRKPSRPYVEA